MKYGLMAFILLLASASFIACGQSTDATPAGKFLYFLNHYQTDSLQALIADDFRIERTYSAYRNDKRSFLDKYVPESKNFHAQYKILKVASNGPNTDFLVEDQSDYLKYLSIDYPEWKIKIMVSQEGKIERMIIDTTQSYRAYLYTASEQGRQFENWLKLKYPKGTNESLYTTPGLLTQRLKEYAAAKTGATDSSR